LEEKTLDQEFWNDNQKAQAVLKEISNHKKWIERIDNFSSELTDIEELADLIDDGSSDEDE
jgi:peptide chain release factor 2